MRNRLLSRFREIFGDDREAEVFFAPGRVNLIGEYTDYNGGHVFPCALDIGTYGVARKRSDKTLRFYSLNFTERGMIESNLDQLFFDKAADWTNYPKGVMWTFQEKGCPLPCGMDLLLYGTIPNGSGLSSSASVEVLTGYILRELYGFEVDLVTLALWGQYSENHFNGVNCGIMDQFAIAMGKKNQALLLNTGNLNYEYAPFHEKNIALVIANSNKKRGLEDSKYNERRSECEDALHDFQKELPIRTLCDLDCEKFEANAHLIKNEAARRRAKHAIYENQRTLAAVRALKNHDMEQFGRLMMQSHISLRDDFEVTGVELDTLYEKAIRQPGVLGARMTGAGFGGCTVNLVHSNSVEAFIENISNDYRKAIGYDADFYVVEAGDGPRKME